MTLFVVAICMLCASKAFACDDGNRLQELEKQVAFLIQKDNSAKIKQQHEETDALKSEVHQLKVHDKRDHHQGGDELNKRINVVGNVVLNTTRPEPEGVVAFTATMRIKQEHIGINQNIVFNRVLFNLSGGYHVGHGLFIAPQSSVYLFSISLMTHEHGHVEICADLVHNGNMVSRIFGHGDSGRHDHGNVTAMFQLNTADEVWVRNIGITDDSVYGDHFTSFCGILLYTI